MSKSIDLDAIEQACDNETPWLVRLTCCGRDGGVQFFKTWNQADTFRESYLSGAGVHGPETPEGGHLRSALVVNLCDPPTVRALVAVVRAADRLQASEDVGQPSISTTAMRTLRAALAPFQKEGR